MNGDGLVNSTDLKILQQYVMGEITQFPVETATPTTKPTATPVATLTPLAPAMPMSESTSATVKTATPIVLVTSPTVMVEPTLIPMTTPVPIVIITPEPVIEPILPSMLLPSVEPSQAVTDTSLVVSQLDKEPLQMATEYPVDLQQPSEQSSRIEPEMPESDVELSHMPEESETLEIPNVDTPAPEPVSPDSIDDLDTMSIVIQTDYTKGDVNADGNIDLMDVQLVLQHYLSVSGDLQVPNDVYDVDGSGEVDLADVQLILQKYLNVINEFPIPTEPEPVAQL